MKKIIILISIVLVASCSEKERSVSTEQGNFAHSVYFWFNNPDNMVERDVFEASLSNFLDNSKYIQTSHVGVPATTGHRDVVDASYTYSLLLTFKDKDAQDKYQYEAVHKQFIEETKHLWSKIVIYDSENILQ